MTERMPVPTAADVARLAGVSRATVSYVLSGRRSGNTRISDTTRRRVLQAVDRLNYVPNHSAQALSKRRTERICLVLPRLGGPYNDLLAAELRTAASGRGYSTFIAVNDSEIEQSLLMDQLRRRTADGVVFVAEDRLDNDELASLVRQNIAVVVVGEAAATGGVDVVRTDIMRACQEAVEYLAARGHTRIAFMGSMPIADSYSRYEGYRAGMQSCHLPIDDHLVVSGATSRLDAYRSAQQLLHGVDRPTAILAASDIAAVSTIWAARDADLRIPAELAVVGVGDIPEDVVVHPPLTSIGPKSIASQQIADLLFSRLAGEAPPTGRTYVQEWHLIVRGST